MGGYDVWNECNIRRNVCYCPGTQQQFRAWLKAKYGDLRTLGKAWHRPSFAEWADVSAPRQIGPYPDTLDWLQFRIDNAYGLMRWRVDLIRSIDADCAITAHGIAAQPGAMAQIATDDWRAAAEVESYGLTWGSSRHGDEPWKQVHAIDLVRAASRGKPFWHAETYAGPLWMQPQVVGKPRDEGRIASPEDIRYWDLVSFMAGATRDALPALAPAARRPALRRLWPLRHGRLAHPALRDGEPGRQVGHRAGAGSAVAVAPGQGRGRASSTCPRRRSSATPSRATPRSIPSPCRAPTSGFFDNNIQADWVHIDDIAEYDLALPALPGDAQRGQTAEKLRAWVAAAEP